MCKNLIDPATNESVFTFMSEFYRPWQGQTVIEVIILSLIFLVGVPGNAMLVVTPALIFVVGVPGNAMVLAAVIRNKKLKSSTNFLVCNLATTDILFASGIPFIAVTRVTQHWIFGEFVCKFVTYVQFVSGVCSIVTMVMISVERFICVCLMNKYKIQNRDLALIIVAIWCLSAIFPIPVALSQTVRTVHTANEYFMFCGVQWLNGFHAEIYLGFMVSVFFVIPLIFISGFYLRIWRVVKSSDARTQGASRRSENSIRKQIRLVKMFSSIVILFVLMWLPFFIVSFLGVHYKQITSTHFTVTLILALANTCQNPLLYGYFNHRLREEFRIMCCSRFKGLGTSTASAYAVQGTELGSAVNNSSTIG
ncbi:somatostatin receptor type 4-like [Mercenaria mercenaria]|uniref:somatostatin receptor type 4-like n=1 Tax=Mercenaria mercenaria TaxID=6596 RepID=UPI00234E8FA0|nr:somatostatin receptor type 4-like [Mercenaria mercenaria]